MRLVYFIMLFAVFTLSANAQGDPQRISNLESRVTRVEGKVRQAGEAGVVVFIFGAFCALWAQNSGRSGWLWFFLGLFFSFITVLVLLAKNSGDIDRRRAAGRKPFDLQDFRQQ